MRVLIIAATAILASIPGVLFAQTQPTSPSAFASMPSLASAYATSAISPCYSSVNPTSPCYSGTIYPSYSALTPPESFDRTISRGASLGARHLNEDEARSRFEAKGYADVSGLQRDSRGIWRCRATMKDGRSVVVVLDLEGNIYSELNS
jgi:hypothetical protein